MDTAKDERPAQPRMRRVKRDQVRKRLLASAARVFEERGFAGTTLELVAESAGFSKGAVYSNFAGKDELFFELMADRIDERILATTEAVVSVASSSERAEVAGEALRKRGAEDPEWQMLFIEFWLRCMRNPDLKDRFREKRIAMRERIAAQFETVIRESGIESSIPSNELAIIMLALSNGLGIEGMADPDAVPPKLLGTILRKLILDSESD
jgi:AcrR family transcriptional regulator